MITKELQNLSDKLTGGHTSAHEISKQVDYIEKNYTGGGSGGDGAVIFTVNGTFDAQQESWEYTLAEDSSFADIAEHATAGDPMFLSAIKQYNGGATEVLGVYPMSNIYNEYPEPDHTPTVSAVEFGTTRIYELSPDKYIQYDGFKISSDGTVVYSSLTKTL